MHHLCSESSRYYRNYSHLCDDKTVLKNPHKGWYYHFVDNGLSRPTYRDGLSDDEQLTVFPGMNHLYIRFDWSDIEKNKDVYDWTAIDQIIEKYKALGFKFSLRLCTYETGIHNSPFASPKWLADLGTGSMVKINGREFFEPYYDHPLFLEKLEQFMGEYGRKFNGNPLIEYVDVGTFGTWGEGHTSYGSGQKYGIATLLSHVNLHLKYFPDTPVMLNDDMISHLEDSDAAAKEFMEYCAGKGMGLRDDGICVKYYCDTYGYSTLRSPEFFGYFNRRAAVDIELEHYSKISPDDFKDGFPYLEALKTARATFSGFHGYVSPWIQQNRYFTEYCANRLGYWYFINGLTLAHPVSGLKSEATLHIENKGFAAAYHRYALKISARNEMGESFVLNRESPDNRTWLGRTEERLTLDFAKVPPGSYALCIGLYEGRLPVRLALRDNLILEDGSYELDRITVAKPISVMG